MLHFQAKCRRSSGPPMLPDCSSGTAALLQSLLRQAEVQGKRQASLNTKRLQLDQAVIFRDQAAPEAPCASAALGPPTLEQITRGPLQQHRTYVCRWFSSHFKLHTHTGDLAAVSFFSFFLDSNRAATSITTSPLCRSFLRNDRRIAGLMTNRLIESLTK